MQICPESLSWIGLLIYGAVADRKGRKVAFKISWRFYTFGLVLFTATETQFLISFGYLIACMNCFPSLVIQFVLLFEQIGKKSIDVGMDQKTQIDPSDSRLATCCCLSS